MWYVCFKKSVVNGIVKLHIQEILCVWTIFPKFGEVLIITYVDATMARAMPFDCDASALPLGNKDRYLGR
jgi:hypothetical protein